MLFKIQRNLFSTTVKSLFKPFQKTPKRFFFSKSKTDEQKVVEESSEVKQEEQKWPEFHDSEWEKEKLETKTILKGFHPIK